MARIIGAIRGKSPKPGKETPKAKLAGATDARLMGAPSPRSMARPIKVRGTQENGAPDAGSAPQPVKTPDAQAWEEITTLVDNLNVARRQMTSATSAQETSKESHLHHAVQAAEAAATAAIRPELLDKLPLELVRSLENLLHQVQLHKAAHVAKDWDPADAVNRAIDQYGACVEAQTKWTTALAALAESPDDEDEDAEADVAVLQEDVATNAVEATRTANEHLKWVCKTHLSHMTQERFEPMLVKLADHPAGKTVFGFIKAAASQREDHSGIKHEDVERHADYQKPDEGPAPTPAAHNDPAQGAPAQVAAASGQSAPDEWRRDLMAAVTALQHLSNEEARRAEEGGATPAQLLNSDAFASVNRLATREHLDLLTHNELVSVFLALRRLDQFMPLVTMVRQVMNAHPENDRALRTPRNAESEMVHLSPPDAGKTLIQGQPED